MGISGASMSASGRAATSGAAFVIRQDETGARHEEATVPQESHSNGFGVATGRVRGGKIRRETERDRGLFLASATNIDGVTLRLP